MIKTFFRLLRLIINKFRKTMQIKSIINRFKSLNVIDSQSHPKLICPFSRMLSGHQNEHLTIYNQSAKSEWQDGVGSKVNVVQMFWRRSVQFSCHVQCCEKVVDSFKEEKYNFSISIASEDFGATWIYCHLGCSWGNS